MLLALLLATIIQASSGLQVRSTIDSLAVKKVRTTVTSDKGEPPKQPTGVYVYEVDDHEWWNKATAESNPYGMKLWPAAFGW